MRININIISVICLLFSLSVHAEKISSIQVIGTKKIEKDAIINKLTSKVGQEFDPSTTREDIFQLFKLGYFQDVQIEKNQGAAGIELIYRLQEKPQITEVSVEGVEELKADEVTEAAGIKAFELLNQAKLKDAAEKILKLYEDKGFYLAKVETIIDEVAPNETVKIRFKITENDKVKVKQITFIGNKKLSSTFLKSKMMTNEGGYFSSLSGSGQYKQEAFERDVQILRFTYYNQGYVQAKIDRPQVFVTPDKKFIYITIHIEEGEQYNVGEVDFAGDLIFPREELKALIQIDKNGIFAYDVLQKDISELTAKYGDLGYAYANVIPRIRFNDQEKKADLVYEFDKGQKVFFGRINVIGNTKTRDKVVRRELKVREGELYNETRRRESVDAIQRLGFFDDVNFKTTVDPEHNDIMHVDIVVKERNTGQIQAGAGFSSATGMQLNASVSQSNFLGKGQNLGATLNLTKEGSYFNLSFTEPYYNDTLWSLGYDVYQSTNTKREDYDEYHIGGAVRLGHPIGENTRAFFRYKYDNTHLKTKYLNGEPVTDLEIFPLDTANGVTSSVTGTLELDTRNDRYSPSKGMLLSGSYEYAGVGGKIKYDRINGTFRYFKNVFWDVIFRSSLQYARIGKLDPNQDVPFNELYLLGGPYSLRGYDSYRVGKMRRSTKKYNDLIANYPADIAEKGAMVFVGGTQQLLYQAELQYPLIKEAGIMGVIFYDIGAADDTIESDGFYSDVGMGLRWFSPIGPLRFEWGFPLNRDPERHRPVVFEFSIGTPF